MKKYQDTSLTAAKRAEALLGEMTLKEKIGQLNQSLYGFRIYERAQTPEGEKIVLSDEFKEEVKRFGGLGTLYGLYRADPWADKDFRNGLAGPLANQAYNEVQKYVLEHSRLGIPALMSSECPHGHQALDGYLLPVNLAAGATFHPQLLADAYRVCGRQLQSMGVDLALVSMLDVLRDPRWGRSEECYGEDPFLSAAMAKAAVTGMQQAGPAAVAKHFAAQGEGTGGVNASAARIGERELREIHLPPMQACADAGVKGVMAAYNEIDGVYCHANPKLLQDILRDEMGFDGIVMSDGVAIDQLDVMTGDNVVSGALALNAGVDMGLWDTAFGKLEEAYKRGLVKTERIDEAVLRILTLKFERGLFEHPFLPETAGETFSYEEYPQSLEMARQSAVLLKNEADILPIHPQKQTKLAVIGPNADALYHQLGDYTPPIKDNEGITVLKGMQKVFGKDNVRKAQGCYLRGRSQKLLDEALQTAGESDVIVCVLGGSSSRFGGASFDTNGAAVTDEEARSTWETGAAMDCGEGMDCADLSLPKEQLELLETVSSLQKPVICVVICGRPLALTEVCAQSAAVLLSFYPGPMGGLAIAELLAGWKNPSGRLPASLPRLTGQVPVYYNYKGSYQAWHYMDSVQGPLFPFGYGLDYTRYSYRDVKLLQEKLTRDELHRQGVTVRMKIKNEGNTGGYAVPQLYVTDAAASTVRRVKELKAFDKLYLEQGEEKEAELFLTEKEFSLWNERMQFVTEPGVFYLELSDKNISVWKGEFTLCI